MFIDLEKSSIERIMEFVDHHNNYYENFTVKEIKKMEDLDETPGETIYDINIIIREYNNKKQYWAYLGNHGGSSYTIEWAERYFDDIKIFNSVSFEYYDDNWQDWKLIGIQEYINLIKNK